MLHTSNGKLYTLTRLPVSFGDWVVFILNAEKATYLNSPMDCDYILKFRVKCECLVASSMLHVATVSPQENVKLLAAFWTAVKYS